MDNRKHLTDYVTQIVSTLRDGGAKNVVVSPGSRSTPLAYAFVKSQDFTLYRQIDERSAAYFALGLAKAENRPTVLLCTSGTAAANYMPAVVEAFYSRIPLIVLTADRPPELREVGAPQAIDQLRMYGQFVKWSTDFPVPEDNEEVLRFVERHTQRAVSIATTAPFGPVHINVPLREPLLIDFDQEERKSTFVKRFGSSELVNSEAISLLEETVAHSKRGIIIVGEMKPDVQMEHFWTFARKLNWPVLADPLSRLRSNVPDACRDLLIDQYDALLKSEVFKEKVIPDAVIRFGAQPVSKPLTLFLKAHRIEPFIVVDESPSFRDPFGGSSYHIQASPEVLWQEVQVEGTSQLELWITANTLSSKQTERYVQEESDEGALAGILFNEMPSKSDLIASSSMPIRDVDTFFSKTQKDIGIYANRGVNGIDGVVSTAFGIQAANQRPAYLLIGDLAFLHDQNGLIISRFHEVDMTVVIMNNDGGGIFSYLPQSTVEEHFEHLFGTPTGLTFGEIAKMYDAEYFPVRSREDMIQTMRQPKKKPIRIIEAFTDRKTNTDTHRKLWKRIDEELSTKW
ncbi:2-succinyl-5-enolpyruvyl-6-hydroxy-3-cyclohexene-1-carboxylic-acid synthase [Chungangia koreensis]|uniref:2-succinyl-5-enolpyruvyl-6-hydroxy-3-cyclohexene-1-carboxylate synthase n=1 Tax=Chungangia koreensis TaxID=752657 RepID=A0ABV8X2Z6_9LACT